VTAAAHWLGEDLQQADLSLTLNGAGETFYEIDNALRSPPRAWWDAQISHSVRGLTLTLWGRNITDERWAISAFGQGMLPLLQGLGPGGPFDTFTINRGRQVGVSVRRNF
jgi:outer membrane receptor protein involved in Fe transport